MDNFGRWPYAEDFGEINLYLSRQFGRFCLKLSLFLALVGRHFVWQSGPFWAILVEGLMSYEEHLSEIILNLGQQLRRCSGGNFV